MASKTIAVIDTANDQQVTVAVGSDNLATMRTAKDKHNRSVSKLDADAIRATIDALTVALGMIEA